MSKSVQDKIKDQVEFYFSDSNLPGDKFLRTQVASHPEGYVSIETIASFKRMQQLTQNLEEVVSALKASELLEVDETGKLVRRKTPLADPEILRNRTIYAKGFPKEGTDVDTVTEFFNKHGTVKCVRLRKIPKSKEFKGSVFVEFATEEEAQKVSKETLKFGETDLIVMMKKDHEELKKKEREEFQQKKSQKKQEEKRAAIASSLQYQENALLKLTVGTEGEIDIAKIKEALKPVFEAAATAWIDYEIGSGVAFMKFRQAEQAGECLKAIQEKKPSIGGKEATVALVTGEEEKEYYVKQEEQKQNARFKKGKGGKGGFNKGGKKRKQGGEGSENGENRSPKKQRTEKKQE